MKDLESTTETESGSAFIKSENSRKIWNEIIETESGSAFIKSRNFTEVLCKRKIFQ
jgi:hypothetical protein